MGGIRNSLSFEATAEQGLEEMLDKVKKPEPQHPPSSVRWQPPWRLGSFLQAESTLQTGFRIWGVGSCCPTSSEVHFCLDVRTLAFSQLMIFF